MKKLITFCTFPLLIVSLFSTFSCKSDFEDGDCPNVFIEDLSQPVDGMPKYVDLVVEINKDRKLVVLKSYTLNFKAIAEYQKLDGDKEDIGGYEIIGNVKRYTKRLRIINWRDSIIVSVRCPHEDLSYPHHKTDHKILDPRRRK